MLKMKTINKPCIRRKDWRLKEKHITGNNLTVPAYYEVSQQLELLQCVVHIIQKLFFISKISRNCMHVHCSHNC